MSNNSKITNVIGYSDGACSIKGAGFHPGGWGATISYFDGESGNTMRWHMYDGKAKTTNNEMEMTGMLKLVELVPRGVKECILHSDSEYVLKSIVSGGNGIIQKRMMGKGVEFSGWVGGWMRNGWKNSKNEAVKNMKLWETLTAAITDLANSGTVIEFKYVKGHSGVKGNEIADVLSTLGTTVATGGKLSVDRVYEKIEKWL